MMRLGPLFFILFAGTMLGAPSAAFAITASEIQAQINENNRQLETLKAEIASYQKQLETLASEKNTLQSTVNSLALSQKQLATQIQVTQNKISSANLQIRELSNSIGDKEALIAADQAAIAKSLRTIAENERQSLITRLISSHTLGDAWQMAETMAQFSRALGDDVRELQTVRTELASDRDDVTAAKAKLVALQDELSLQKKSVDLQKVAQQKLLTETKNQESSYQKMLANKKAEEAAFESALFELESQLQYVLDPSHIPPAGKGVLRWPLANVFITQQFGKTSFSKRLYTSGTHNGIDFRTKDSSNPSGIGVPIRAALSGTVLALNHGAVPNCQYGKWVLIKHGNGLATLYAHLSDISVSQGATVVTGQLIGFSGNTGYAVGPHLHFSVYVAEAVSFKQYTCWNRSVMTIPVAPVNAYLDPLLYL